MKKLMFLLIFALMFMGLSAEGAYWAWAKQIEGTGGYDQGKAIGMDASGNTYVSGYFSGTAIFGTTSLTSSRSSAFVAKMDPNGNWLWAKQSVGSASAITYGQDLAVDATGNCYITGTFDHGTITFGTITLNGFYYGPTTIFVAKLDTNGNWLWAKDIGGVYSYFCKVIGVDALGNCYISGTLGGTFTFGTTVLSYSNGNVFVAKMDTNGNWLWARQVVGSQYWPEGIAVDATGNCYLTGGFQYTATFGTTTITSSGSRDIFVAKLDSNGNWLWAKRAGGASYDNGYTIAVDTDGNSYFSGEFQGTTTFGTTVLSASNGNIIVVKMDTNGNWLWAKQAGGTSWNGRMAIDIDSVGNCYINGTFRDIATFGTTILTSNGSNDIFVAKLDPNGNWLWAKQAGAEYYDIGQAIAVDPIGNCFVTGYFEGNTTTFGNTSLTNSDSAAIDHIFVAKLALTDSPQTPVNINATMNGYDAVLAWDAVTENTQNQPQIPDYYLVYFNDSPDPNGVFSLLEMSSTNQFTHTNVALDADHMFYRVTAIKLYPPVRAESTDVQELKSRLQQVLKVGMTESEVSKALDHLWDERQ